MESHDGIFKADPSYQGGPKFALTFKSAASIEDNAGQITVKSAIAS